MHFSRCALRIAAHTTLLAVALSALGSGAASAATSTWVSGVGDDANPCSRTAPCKTFAGAISKTDTGGEINTLDPGVFGAVTITKPITIDGTGTLGNIVNSGTNGIIINITAPYAHPDVTLRGLSIQGSGNDATACPWAGLNGIRALSVGTLRIEDVNIGSVENNGIDIAPTLLSPHVVLDNVRIGQACGAAVNVNPGAGANATVSVIDSVLTKSTTGVRSGTGGNVRVTGSSIVNTVLGLDPAGGTIETSRDTSLFDNTADGTPTRIYDAIAAGPTGAQGPQGPSGTPGVAKLVVVFGAATTSGTAGKKIVLTYGATAGGTATLTVRKGAKVVDVVSEKAKRGKNVIKWDGKLGAKAAPRGAYKVQIDLAGAGQATTDKAVVVLR